MNEQKALPPEHTKDGATLAVHSVFYTIQGEGPFAGRTAVFVRLAGCNLQCPACDTEYSNGSRVLGLPALLAEIAAAMVGNAVVVITGGEPFRQNIAPLVQMLRLSGCDNVQVETNGTMPVPEDLPLETVIVVSPKTPFVHPTVASRARAWKYVIGAEPLSFLDGLPYQAVLGKGYQANIARPPAGFPVCDIFVQPLDTGDAGQDKIHLQHAASACLRYGYRLSVQLHKLVGIA